MARETLDNLDSILSLFNILLPICISKPPNADQAWANGVLGIMNDKSFIEIIDIGRSLLISRSITRVSNGTCDSLLKASIGLIVPSKSDDKHSTVILWYTT